MAIHMDDGQDVEIGPGDVVAIPSGHHAEVTGDEPCVMVDFGQFSDYAKR
jgi:mannose-6-phosphate isomerase-like protein (cupin superfamily)